METLQPRPRRKREAETANATPTHATQPNHRILLPPLHAGTHAGRSPWGRPPVLGPEWPLRFLFPSPHPPGTPPPVGGEWRGRRGEGRERVGKQRSRANEGPGPWVTLQLRSAAGLARDYLARCTLLPTAVGAPLPLGSCGLRGSRRTRAWRLSWVLAARGCWLFFFRTRRDKPSLRRERERERDGMRARARSLPPEAQGLFARRPAW